MAIKGIIVLPCTDRYSPARIGDFLWTIEFEKHIFNGKAMGLEEFNKASKMVFEDVEQGLLDHQPYAELVEVKDPVFDLDKSAKPKRTRHKKARRRRDIKLTK